MRILFLGDVVGRSGREVVIEHLPKLKKDLKLDMAIVNAENAAAGFGMTAKICNQLYEAGTDVITGGNHSFDNREIMQSLDADKRLLRPINYPDKVPGRGFNLYDGPRGKKILVINAMCRVFMNPLDCPFDAVDAVLKKYPLGGAVGAVIVDIHGEATSEKMAMGHFCDGRASLVVGTHSHVPTGDTQILNGGTAYQTDAGMCGDYDSVIGMDKEEPLRRFVTKLNSARFAPAGGPATLCGIYIETDDRTGKALRAEPVRIGPRLIESIPSL